MSRASLFLGMAEALFLWMFLATEPLELLADNGRLSGPQNVDVGAAAYQFAARWRHGMAGHSPIYMPGFFAVALTAWPWALRRSVAQMAAESATLLLAGLLAALIVQPYGASVVVNRFEREFGAVAGSAPANTGVGIVRAIYTLLTFKIGIVTIQRVLAMRKLVFFLIPLVMNAVLSQIRPWTVGDFMNYWLQRAIHFDFVAWLSLATAVVAAMAMFHTAWITGSRSREAGSGAVNSSARPAQGTDTPV